MLQAAGPGKASGQMLGIATQALMQKRNSCTHTHALPKPYGRKHMNRLGPGPRSSWCGHTKPYHILQNQKISPGQKIIPSEQNKSSPPAQTRNSIQAGKFNPDQEN
eukprot:9326924-Alexandrium_andersonii.AAC.1